MFLQSKIAQFLFVTQTDFAFECKMSGRIGIGGIFGDDFGAFNGEDDLLEAGYFVETPS